MFPEFNSEHQSRQGSRCPVRCVKLLWLSLDSVRSPERIVEVRVSSLERINSPQLRCDVEVNSGMDKRGILSWSSTSKRGNRRSYKRICGLNCIVVGLSRLEGSV